MRALVLSVIALMIFATGCTGTTAFDEVPTSSRVVAPAEDPPAPPPGADTTVGPLGALPPEVPGVPALDLGIGGGISGDENITNVNTPTFAGKAEPGSTVTILRDGEVVGSGVAPGGEYRITTDTIADGHHSFTVTATNAAGLTSPTSAPLLVTIDTTPPTYGQPERAPGSEANDNGWNRTDAMVEFSCEDAGSGVEPEKAIVTVVVSTEGANQTATAPAEQCVDRAGNVAAAPASLGGINIDKTPPTYGQAVRAPRSEANAAGWNNKDVTVNFPCNDALSGPVTALVVKTLSAEGRDQTATAQPGECVDQAGNVATAPASMAGINIDKTPPTVNFGSATPAANAAGWHNANVSVPFTVSDALSGVDPSGPSGPLVLDREGTAVTGEITVRDLAGNTAIFTSPAMKIDKTPPTYGNPARAAGTEANVNGWDRDNVVVDFPCIDSLSGPRTPMISKTIEEEGENQTALSPAEECVDQAGNVATSPASFGGINIDRTPPSYGPGVRAAGSQANAAEWNRTNVTVNFPCNDSLSGPVSATVSRTISAEGSNQTVTAPAEACVDRAGNVAAAPASLGGINIDKTPPSLTILSTQPTIVSLFPPRVRLRVTFTSSDPLPRSGVAKVECRLVGDSPGDCASPWNSRTIPATESPVVEVRVTDVAGNATRRCLPAPCPPVILDPVIRDDLPFVAP